MVLTHFCYPCMVLSSIQADRITFLTSSTDYLLAASHSAGLILATDFSMLCDQCKGWVSWRMAVPHSSCAITPWTGMGCRRAADAGQSSPKGAGQGTCVLLAPGLARAAGEGHGSRLHRDTHSLFRPALPKGFLTQPPALRRALYEEEHCSWLGAS